MVYFKESKSSKRDYLVTVGRDKDPVEKGVKHVVLPPITGAFAEKWPPMQYPRHLDHWCKEQDLSGLKTSQPVLLPSHHHSDVSTMPLKILRTSLATGEAKWSSNQQFGSEFTHIPFYWEWLEDILRNCRPALKKVHIIDAVHASLFLYSHNVHLLESLCEHWSPKTNTLETVTGEVSISLWDIRYLGGLPIAGALYDEVVPCFTELLHGDDGENLHLPPSCKRLFVAYHRILAKNVGRKHVSFEDWCRFWFRGAPKYSVENRPMPKKDFSSYGDPQLWDDNIHGVFRTLNVPGSERAQTYFAAFLSCWICSFVLPVRDLGSIRPGVFKVASLLASGKAISLAIPVLASIYRGLNDISASTFPGKNPGYFAPHYVYAWLARYYRSHRVIDHGYLEASMITYEGVNSLLSLPIDDVKYFIPSGNRIIWRSVPFGTSKDEKCVDGVGVPVCAAESLITLRSSFLTLRHEDCNIIEPYSPHRFARQFGFCQDVPGELEHDIRRGTLERLFKLFGSSTKLGTKSNFIIPSGDLLLGSTTSTAYDAQLKTEFAFLLHTKVPTPSRSPDTCRDGNGIKLGKRKLKSVVTQTPPEGSAVDPDNLKKRNTGVKLNRDRLEKSTKKQSSLSKDKVDHVGKTLAPHMQDKGELQEKVGMKIAKGHPLGTTPCGDDPKGPSLHSVLEDFSEEDELDETGLQDDADLTVELGASNISLTDCGFYDDYSDLANEPIIRRVFPLVTQENGASEVEKVTDTSFDFEAMILQAEQQANLLAVASIADSFRRRLLMSSHENLSKCKLDVEVVYTYARSKNIDISEFETRVTSYIDCASQLGLLKREMSCQIPALQVEERLQVISSEEVRLRKELANLSKERDSLKTTLGVGKGSAEKVHTADKAFVEAKTTLEDFKF